MSISLCASVIFTRLSRTYAGEGAVSEERAVLYTAELVLALGALHEKGVVYRCEIAAFYQRCVTNDMMQRSQA